ncbi:MAG: hypothetical protein ACTSUE_16395 [Promethearchaeota archaeon]
MFSKKVDKWKMNRSKGDKESIEATSRKYRASLDKNTSIEIIKDRDIYYWIIKKACNEFETYVDASEAPISNLYAREPDAFETCIIEKSIFDKEIFPISDAIRVVFGTNAVELDRISLAIGSNETDYVTLDENDMKKQRVEPTLEGIKEFVEKNKDSILGIGIREFDTEKGNLLFLKTKLVRPTKNIISIELLLLSSVHQRGFYIQKEHSWVGIQKYLVIKTNKIDDEKLLMFFKELGINWEVIFLRRSLAINDWLEIECENNLTNLKTFLRYKFHLLVYVDVQNIVKIVEKNNLSFKAAVRMAELLEKQKREMQIDNIDTSYQPIVMAEIIAAARLSAAYHGEKVDIEFDQKVRIEDILRYERILTNY